MKRKMSPRRAAEECKELKSILSDNRVNTSFAKNRNRVTTTTTTATTGAYNRWTPYVDESFGSSSKCLKRTKECWKVDKQKKFKIDFSSGDSLKGSKKSDIEIANKITTMFRLHENRPGDFYTPIPSRNDATAPGFDYGLGTSVGPPTYRYPNESETESRLNKMGDFYFRSDKTISNGSNRCPDCNYTSTGICIPRHLVSASSSSPSSSMLAANLYCDSGSPNDYYHYYNYYYHQQQQQQQQQPHHPNTPSIVGKDAECAWDYFEPQFNSISNFYHKSFPPFDWYQYGDQWQGWTDQYAQGENGHYSYPQCYAPPSSGTSSTLQKSQDFPRIESENSKRNQMLKHLPNDRGNPTDLDSTRESELQNRHRISEREVGSSSGDFKEAVSPAASPSSLCSSSSPSLKSRDVDSTGSPGMSSYQSVGRKGSLDPKTCLSQWGEKSCPRSWLAVDKSLVEDLIDNIMTGNKSNAVNNHDSGLNNGSAYVGSGNSEGMRLAVL